MNVLDHFSIPYIGLKNGTHRFVFEVDDAFFESFENSYVSGGDLKVELDLDKASEMAIADFQVVGSVDVTCDRCLQIFDMPVEADFKLHIKVGEVDPDQDEVLFIDSEASIVNFATYIYESISLWLPMSIVHDDISECDPEMVSRMRLEDDGSKPTKSEIWDSLKGLDFD